MQATVEPRINGQRYAWIGYAMGIACMAALFITGLAMGQPQLTVMASSMAVLLGAVWASTAATARKRSTGAIGTQDTGIVVAREAGESQPSAQAARELLNEASRLESAARSGAGWPHIAMLLGLGAITSLSMLAFWFVGRFDESLVALPLVAMLIWLGIFMVFMMVFGRSTKRGFGRRWMTFMMIWAGLWVIGILLASTLLTGQFWFAIVIATAITINSVIGAWLEARA